MPAWPITAKMVADTVEVTGVTEDSVPLASAAAAASTWVAGTARPDLAWLEPAFVCPADVWLGAVMLAWRWYERRASPLGVVTAPTGDPVEMLRNDPDIAKMLGVAGGSEGAFVFGAVERTPYRAVPYDEIGYLSDGTPYLK